MMADVDPRLERAGREVGRVMGEILRLFRPGARITVLVRTPEGEREPRARDFIMTNDDLAEIRAMIQRRATAEIAAQS